MPKDISLFMDYCKVSPPTTEEVASWNDNLAFKPATPEGMRASRDFGLEVTLEATHSAFFNDNMRFYIPSRMEDGAKSFVQGRKPAKILKHHDAHSDPVGIVIGAEYIQTIPDGLESDRDVHILTDSSFSVKRQLAAARRLMKTGIPFSDNWRGLGYVQLKAVIFDQKTIEQINHGLFDAVSTSFVSPGHVYCSICGTNLATDGFCEHEPGNTYEDAEEEDVVCALIPGVHQYRECSLVVFDADPLTAIQIGMEDSKENKNKIYQIPVDSWKNSSTANDHAFAYEFKDYKEENIMGNNQVELSDVQKEVFDFVDKLRPDMDNDAKLELAQKIAGLKDEEGNYPHQDEAELDLETYVLFAIENSEATNQEINADEVYAEMEKELAEDAKLSAEIIAKLPDSAFCGPERSFPVPDSAHAVAAKQLIARYQGPGDKIKILASINRKATAFGCDNDDSTDEESQDSTQEEVKFEIPTSETLEKLSDKETKDLFNMLESEAISRKLKFSRPCGKCAAAEDAAKEAVEETKQIQDKIEDLENTLRVLRSEMKFQMEDYFRQVDHQVLLDTQLKSAKLEKVVLKSVLAGKYENIEKANDSLKDADLDKEEAVLNDTFKLEDIVDKLNDGMYNKNPEGIVEDPTHNKDEDNQQLSDKLPPQALGAIKNIKLFRAQGHDKQAKALYDRMVAMNYFSTEDVPFECLSVEDAAE